MNYEGVVAPIEELPAGIYNVYVSGISSNGYPTTTALSSQKSFEVMPDVFMSSQKIVNPVQTYELALSNDTIAYNGSISNSVFMENNYIMGSELGLERSDIGGTLYVNNSMVYLNDTNALNIVLNNSTLVMIESHSNDISVSGTSKIVLQDSSYNVLSPSKAKIDIISPVFDKAYNNSLLFKATVSGNNIAYTEVLINDNMIKNTTSTSIDFSYNVSSMADGSYNVTFMAVQTDGMVSYNYTTLNVENGLNKTNSNINKLSNGLNKTNSNLNKTNSTVNKVSKSNSVVYDVAYAGVGLGALGSAVGIFTVLRRK